MKIKEILWRNRNDFQAVYECEFCQATQESYGYDDANFHLNVIPNSICKVCKKKSVDLSNNNHS
jgi:hypothetical protein